MSRHIQTILEAAVCEMTIVWVSPNINLPAFSDYRSDCECSLFSHVQKLLAVKIMRAASTPNRSAHLKSERKLPSTWHHHIRLSIHPNNLSSNSWTIMKLYMNTVPAVATPILLLLISYHQ
jgi:hypothetical protein